MRECATRARTKGSDMNLDSLMNQPAWMKQSRCLNSDPELWWYERINHRQKEAFEEQVLRLQVAVEYCNECPVRKECLAMGLEKENMMEGGVWGGLLYSERLYLTGQTRHASVVAEHRLRQRLRNKVVKLIG